MPTTNKIDISNNRDSPFRLKYCCEIGMMTNDAKKKKIPVTGMLLAKNIKPIAISTKANRYESRSNTNSTVSGMACSLWRYRLLRLDREVVVFFLGAV